MPTIDAKIILLDIEGTTSSVNFVFDVLFPYARERIRTFLQDNLDTSEVAIAIEKMANDLGFPAANAWLGETISPCQKIEKIVSQAHAWMDEDAKLTGLKDMQGLIWQKGYQSAELKSHVYPDVPLAMQRWVKSGKSICIYSSGSIRAQKSFFKHTEYGDLTEWISNYFDTTSGPKREQRSYENIAGALSAQPNDIVFLSDITDELKAARLAGAETILVIRPGNKEQTESELYSSVREFSSLCGGPEIQGVLSNSQ